MRTLQADVVVLGGGPAGLAAAIELRARGVEKVVVLERETEAGGAPRHCNHPPFGMREFHRILTGPAYARRLVDSALQAGVEIRTRHHAVSIEPGGELKLTAPDGLVSATAKRVLIATGARETPRSARLENGQRPWGVINTGSLQAHLYLRGLKPFRSPIIAGTELVSLSSVWSCVKAGIRPVAVIESNARPTVSRLLALLPRLLGIPVLYGTEIDRIRGDDRVTGVVVRDREGQARELACDGVLLTGKFVPESALVRASHLAVDPAGGGPNVDACGRASDPSYYFAGNVLHPVEAAGWCSREGRAIARTIAKDLAGEAVGTTGEAIAVDWCASIKYVVPSLLRASQGHGLQHFHLRVTAETRGCLTLTADDQVVWRKRMHALPERRILIPIASVPRGAKSVRIAFGDGSPCR